MSSYPEAPEGWTPVARRAVGPFTTHLTFRRPDGSTTVWSSRAHHKHASRLSRVAPQNERVWWAPERASWWIGILFVIGSSCFLLAPFPGFVELVGSGVDGMVFFVGSVFFTSAATLQCLETFNADREPGGTGHRQRLRLLAFEPRRIDWWSSVLQLVGTLLFNVNTFRAMQTGLEQPSYDRLVWRPDAVGSACFLVSGYLAYVEVCGGLACRPRVASSGGSQPSTLPDASPSGSRPLPPMSFPRQEAWSTWLRPTPSRRLVLSASSSERYSCCPNPPQLLRTRRPRSRWDGAGQSFTRVDAERFLTDLGWQGRRRAHVA
jgi:hypothetical protein